MKILQELTDEELLALEEGLYDMEVDGVDIWFERDEVLWEIERRRLTKK